MPLRPTVYSPQLWIIREKVALNWKWGGPGVIHQGCKLQFSLELSLDITSCRKPRLNLHPTSPSPELDALSQTHHSALSTLNYDPLIHMSVSLTPTCCEVLKDKDYVAHLCITSA